MRTSCSLSVPLPRVGHALRRRLYQLVHVLPVDVRDQGDPEGYAEHGEDEVEHELAAPAPGEEEDGGEGGDPPIPEGMVGVPEGLARGGGEVEVTGGEGDGGTDEGEEGTDGRVGGEGEGVGTGGLEEDLHGKFEGEGGGGASRRKQRDGVN